MLKIIYSRQNLYNVIIKKNGDAKKAQTDSARPRKEKKEIMRDDVARKAYELFMEQGYEKTTMRQIAYRAKILNGSLYNLFPSKDHIFDYIFMKIIDKRQTKCQRIIEGEKDYLFALALPYALELFISKDAPKVAELVHEANSNWDTFNKIVDLDIGWIVYVSDKFGVPFDQDHIKQTIISVDGSFMKFVDRYIYTDEGDAMEDLRILIIHLFTLLNLPVHGVDQLIQKFRDVLSSPDIWTDMELWHED